ncbi:MAG: ATP synthase F1 subunit epsilon [Candidatus Eisenbacteria bacterium]|nr:ATP synthase F1 subunit epsilon [Candidatus Eisenbacteria bacterium]
MAETFHLSVLTPTASLLDEEVESAIFPGSEGYLGVLAHHAPLLTALIPGKITVRRPDGTTSLYAVSGGFLEVSGNRANVLADALEEAGSIDTARATRALERARARMKEHGKWDTTRNEAALRRAQNRLGVVHDAKS